MLVNVTRLHARRPAVKLTWELMLVFFNVLEHVVVSVSDDETLAENVDDGSDVQVLRSVVGGRLGQTASPRDTTSVEVLAALEARVADWRLVDGQRVVRQTVDEDEPSTTFFFPRVFLPSSSSAIVLA